MKTIPKIIHQIHLGQNAMKAEEVQWQNTWKLKNPDWDFILWDDEKVKKDLNITYLEIFNECKNFSEKSDVLRFDILYQFGGLYIDTDFECLKNIDPLFENKEVVLFRQSEEKICGAFFGATKGNDHVKKLIDGLPERYERFGKRPDVISDVKYGPEYVTHTLGYEIAEVDGFGSEKKTVYPYMWWQTTRKTEDFSKTHPEAYAVHHWGSSWVADTSDYWG